MKKLKILLGIAAACAFISSCSTLEDRKDIDNLVTSPHDFTAKQTSGYDNQLVVTLNNTNAVAFWDILRYDTKARITMSNKRLDTIVLPFKGEYLLRSYAYFNNGVVVDSQKITTSQADPKYFANPYWGLLSNSSAGKLWVLTAKYVGPESDMKSNWWQPDISGELWGDDSIYFDLNFGFNYLKFHNGPNAASTFSLETDGYTAHPNILALGSGVNLPNDDAAEMAPANVNKFRIFKLTTDTLIVGQGASLTASRTTEDWSWYWIYVKK